MVSKYPVTDAWLETLRDLSNYIVSAFKTVQSNKTYITQNPDVCAEFKTLCAAYESDYIKLNSIFESLNDWIADETKRPVAIYNIGKYTKQTQELKVLIEKLK